MDSIPFIMPPSGENEKEEGEREGGGGGREGSREMFEKEGSERL